MSSEGKATGVVDLDCLAEAATRLFGAEVAAETRPQLKRIATQIAAVAAYPLPDGAVPFRHPVEYRRTGNTPGGQVTTTGLPREVARRRSGDGTATAAAKAFRLLIAEHDPLLKAWVTVDPVLDGQAAALDNATFHGPLYGLSVGIKDIFNVRGLPTRAGSALLAAAGAAASDAAAVARLRSAGALIAGKTATTEFAASDPAETVNPWNPEHTPGGMSSGSAAAVAAGMVDAAIGSQTAGSVLRPASYCGIVGFKPDFGAIDSRGMLPFSWSLDTVGVFSRSVAIARRLFEAMRLDGGSGPPEPAYGGRPPRIGIIAPYLGEHTAPGMQVAVEQAAHTLELAGATPINVSLPKQLNLVFDAHHLIMASEGAAYHLAAHADRIGELRQGLRRLVMTGATIPASAYLQAQRVRGDLVAQTRPVFGSCDVLLTAAAPGVAPRGLASTGDPALNTTWSLFGWPAISLPVALDGGMPLGVQLIGPPGGDDALLDAAEWCEGVLQFSATPPRRFG